MEDQILGIHHVTAIAGEPQKNIDFYNGILGLRMVKLTVNYDDPTTYHLYYGDEEGRPGSIMTFFPWPSAPKGRIGTGQLTATSFSIPKHSLPYWMNRLKNKGVPYEGPVDRFDEQALRFKDHDELRLELVAHEHDDTRAPWKDGPIPVEYGIRGFYSVTLTEDGYQQTARVLSGLGFHSTEELDTEMRYEVDDGGPGKIVNILCQPTAPLGLVSVGTVHHVAWRTPNDQQQLSWRQKIAEMGLNVTPVIDRKYFHSIYFREPGGVLFEVATDPPGFTVDQPVTELGTRLMLPPWLEPERNRLEQELPRIKPPKPLAESISGGH
ncbi:MAG TPA: ring-cleaving dioxygenase [Candidatus Binatus sp.]|nr:ring-cleaving dioxygenase [Candidatus Binatus sp.]